MSSRSLIAVATAILMVILFSVAGVAEQLSQVKVSISSRDELSRLGQLHLDEVEAEDGSVIVVVTHNQLQLLAQSGLSYSIEIPDLKAFFKSRFEPGRAMGGYRTLAEIELVMDSIANANPTIVKPKWSIGNTIEGRPIYVMKISDNPNVDESEPEVYYYAAIHAREVITPEVLIYLMRHLTNSYGVNPAVTELVNSREIFVSCVTNPDGYYYNEFTDPDGGGMWRKNRRANPGGTFGVDLNRNFGYQWGYDNSGSSPDPEDLTYRGSGPFSEPETQALRDFCIARNFKVILTYHSYSDLLLWPWGYFTGYTPDQDIFEQIGDTIRAMAGYQIGTPWELLYPVNGSTDDWGYGEQTLKDKAYSMTIEVGSSSDNFWPPTNRITPLVQKNLNPNLFVARIADRPEKLRVPVFPTIYPVGLIQTTTVDLYWHHVDAENPAVSFELEQLSNKQRVADNLEAGNSNWLESGFAISTTRAKSGTKSYFGGFGANQNNGVTTKFPTVVNSGDSLKFWIWYDTENNYDYGYVQVSSNGGQSWTNIAGNITTTNNPFGQNLGNGITGSSGSAWVFAKFSLAAFAGQDVLIRFKYITDGFVNNPGIWIDDVESIDAFGTQLMLSTTLTDTTFQVTGLTQDDYYYRVRAKDAEGQYSAYSALEQVTVSLCDWLVGDADNSGGYSIADAVFVINYIFSGGVAPQPNVVGSGDTDCSGAVSIADAVYLINHIFSGGPGPAPSCDCLDF